MAFESQNPGQQQMPAAGGALRRTLLLLSIAIMALGGLAAPLFTRIYFLHGGRRLWLTSLLQSCAFPVLFLPLFASFLRRRQQRGDAAGVFEMTGRAAVAFTALGVASGVDAYMFAYSSATLPVSTSTLLSSTQLAFTAGFAFLIVRQRFTVFSVNAVVLLVMGAVELGLQAARDRPAGESSRKYYLGFVVTLGAAALLGLVTPLMELSYLKMKREVTHVLVLETQVVMATSASALIVVAMLVNKDFQAIPREAKEFGLGETKYYLVLAACAVFWQLTNVGLVGVICCSSSLLAGIVIAVLLPLAQIPPVLALHEKFTGGKGVATAFSVWGFASYLYGEYQQQKKRKQTANERRGASQ